MAIQGDDGNWYNSQVDADARNPSGRVSQVDYSNDPAMSVLGGIGKDIAGGINNAINKWAAEDAAWQETMRRYQEEVKRINSLVDYYCAGNWDAVINTGDLLGEEEYKQHDKRISALLVIAYAKKGNFQDALENFYYYDEEAYVLEPDSYHAKLYSEKIIKTLSDFSNDDEELCYDDDKVLSLLMENLRQAYSKTQRREISKEEFKQFLISTCESEIRNGGGEKFAERLWKITGKYTTKEVLTKIAGNDEKLLKDILINHGFMKPPKPQVNPVSKIIRLVLFGIIAFFLIRYLLPNILAIFK